MPDSVFVAASLPVVVGALAGIIAFAPLALAIRSALRRRGAAGVGRGFPVVGVSFTILIAGALVARLACAPGLLAFVSGELTGFVACWVTVAVRIIARGDGMMR